MSAIKGFFEETFTADDRSITLFRKGDGPAVILLHELPGLTHDTVEFAEWIADRGFHVVRSCASEENLTILQQVNRAP